MLFPVANFKSHRLLLFGYSKHIETKSYFMFANNRNYPQNKPSISSGSINDLPFFCAMECKVRNYTNIWIKLRVGNDDSYMKMIHETK